jgi:hypothetical protein
MQREHTLPCRRSSVVVDQLDRAKIALGTVQRLFGQVLLRPIIMRSVALRPDKPATNAFMLTQVLLARFPPRTTAQASLARAHLRFLKGRILTGLMPANASHRRRS